MKEAKDKKFGIGQATLFGVVLLGMGHILEAKRTTENSQDGRFLPNLGVYVEPLKIKSHKNWIEAWDMLEANSGTSEGSGYRYKRSYSGLYGKVIALLGGYKVKDVDKFFRKGAVSEPIETDVHVYQLSAHEHISGYRGRIDDLPGGMALVILCEKLGRLERDNDFYLLKKWDNNEKWYLGCTSTGDYPEGMYSPELSGITTKIRTLWKKNGRQQEWAKEIYTNPVLYVPLFSSLAKSTGQKILFSTVSSGKYWFSRFFCDSIEVEVKPNSFGEVDIRPLILEKPGNFDQEVTSKIVDYLSKNKLLTIQPSANHSKYEELSSGHLDDPCQSGDEGSEAFSEVSYSDLGNFYQSYDGIQLGKDVKEQGVIWFIGDITSGNLYLVVRGSLVSFSDE